MGRYFGVALLGMGLTTWLARNAAASDARDAITLGFCISCMPGVVVPLYGTLSGQMNAMGWLAVAVYSVLVIGFGYGYLSSKRG
jgi:hypothetical protein